MHVRRNNTTLPENFIHIHGTANKILPLKTAQYKIPHGEHFMIVTEGQQLSVIIRKILG